jgi:hypothetical protein
LSGEADLHSIPADTLISLLIGPIETSSNNKLSILTFIDQPIAVVVNAVTSLLARPGAGHTHDPTVLTCRAACGAGPLQSRRTRSSGAGVSIVSNTVTIIIYAVTALYGRSDLALAKPEAPALTGLEACAADALSSGALSAVVAHPLQRIAVSVLIKVTVAVIVDSVADFLLCDVVGDTDHLAALARGGTTRANALFSSRARRAAARITVVGGTITVIVYSIAALH